MKYRTTRKWDNVEESRNLLYFAQLVDELLFDFSLDTYKPSAMNSSLLCIEAINISKDIERDLIAKPNLQHVLDELYATMQKDLVVKDFFFSQLDSTIEIIKNPKSSFDDKVLVVKLLYRHISMEKYKSATEKLLVKYIEDDSSSFSEIRTLARNYITTLLNMGYSPKFLFRTALDFFYYGSNRIASNTAINDFIDLFQNDNKKYIAIFRVNKVYSSIKNACENFKVIVTTNLDDLNIVGGINFPLHGDYVYLCIPCTKHKDRFGSYKEAKKRLKTISTLYSLFNHKQDLSKINECVLYNVENNSCHKIKDSINPMHKCVDMTQRKAAIELNNLIPNFALQKSSLVKFKRAADLHSLALVSDSTENQLINLWIALESLVPQQSEHSKKSKIQHIVDSIIPFLNLVYMDRLIARLASEAINWKYSTFDQCVGSIEGENHAHKLVKLIALDSYEESRNVFKGDFDEFYILNDRFDFFCNLFKSTKNISKLLIRHNERISWQIRRIYRARNLIVHSGQTPSYTDVLITNIHDYLDIIMKTIIRMSTYDRAIGSIPEAFKYAEILNKAYMNWLSCSNTVLTEENIHRIAGNPLKYN